MAFWHEVVDGYDRDVDELVPRYEGLGFERVHGNVSSRLPCAGGYILDVGAGSGRDAGWFAERGYHVVALEPSPRMRAAGRERHASPRIQWLDDRLPEVRVLENTGLTFDLVWLSGVWHHLPQRVRKRAADDGELKGKSATDMLFANTSTKLMFRSTEDSARQMVERLCPGGPARLPVCSIRPPSTLRPGECYAALPDGRFERRQLLPYVRKPPATHGGRESGRS